MCNKSGTTSINSFKNLPSSLYYKHWKKHNKQLLLLYYIIKMYLSSTINRLLVSLHKLHNYQWCYILRKDFRLHLHNNSVDNPKPIRILLKQERNTILNCMISIQNQKVLYIQSIVNYKEHIILLHHLDRFKEHQCKFKRKHHYGNNMLLNNSDKQFHLCKLRIQVDNQNKYYLLDQPTIRQGSYQNKYLMYQFFYNTQICKYNIRYSQVHSKSNTNHYNLHMLLKLYFHKRHLYKLLYIMFPEGIGQNLYDKKDTQQASLMHMFYKLNRILHTHYFL